MTSSNELLNHSRRVAELEIQTSIVWLASVTDDGDLTDYEALLATEVVFESAGMAAYGAQAVLAGMHDRRAAGTTGPGSNTRHVVSNIEVVVSATDNAEARTDWQFFTNTHGARTLVLSGKYHDRWIRTLDGWRLAERRVAVG
ncbi:MAG: nuclear transport factor 2 family protein [Thermoleophilia bacterium]